MRLWIDDLRPAPEGWHWAKSSTEAIDLLWHARELDFDCDEISFDHDLGEDDTTRRVVLWIIENDYPWPAVCRVHTANPVGRDWLEGMINAYGPGVTH